MKRYRMAFEYWEDRHTALIRKTKGPEFVDPDYYIEAHFHPKGSPEPYFLNRRCRRLYDRHGPFQPPRYLPGEDLVDSESGRDVFVVCPGPSLSHVERSRLRQVSRAASIAVNSAGFAVRCRYWLMAESAYVLWLIKKDPSYWGALHDRQVLATARVATVLRAHEKSIREFGGILMEKTWVLRWEEEKVVPPRVPGVSVFNAIATAWEMSARRVFLLGLDLSKDGGPYAKGVPYTKEGAKNPFDEQIRAIRQIEYPGLEIYNSSPISRNSLPFEYVPYEELPI